MNGSTPGMNGAVRVRIGIDIRSSGIGSGGESGIKL